LQFTGGTQNRRQLRLERDTRQRRRTRQETFEAGGAQDRGGVRDETVEVGGARDRGGAQDRGHLRQDCLSIPPRDSAHWAAHPPQHAEPGGGAGRTCIHEPQLQQHGHRCRLKGHGRHGHRQDVRSGAIARDVDACSTKQQSAGVVQGLFVRSPGWIA